MPRPSHVLWLVLLTTLVLLVYISYYSSVPEPRYADLSAASAVVPARLRPPTQPVAQPSKFHAFKRVKEEAHIAVLMFACDRPGIARALDKIFAMRPSTRFPIIVSQDCGDVKTSLVIDSYADRLIHLKYPDGDSVVAAPGHNHFVKYYRIAAHYRWALKQAFDVLLFNQVIVVEDDLDVSLDFFDYFDAMLPLLKHDPTLYCVSSWNDNGKTDMVSDATAFRRSDFMPGLGWMLTRDLWAELRPKWPRAFWDDWMRLPAQRKGRACIIPEVSRNFNFGKEGTSQGEFYDAHIAMTAVNESPVNYTGLDIATLEKESYDARFLADVYDHAEPVPRPGSMAELDQAVAKRIKSLPSASQPVALRIEYTSKDDFIELAKRLVLMDDIRIDVPRSSYLGVVQFKRKLRPDGAKESPRIVSIYIAPVRGAWRGDIALL